MAVARRGRAVDDDEAASLEDIDEPGGRVDRKRRPRDHEQIGLRDCGYRLVKRALVEGFFVQHDCGLHDAPACGATRHAVGVRGAQVEQPFDRVGSAAAHAGVAQHAAVQFKHVSTAGFLVEPVDVLGDHGAQRAVVFEFGECAVRAVRLGIEREHAFAVEVEELARVRVEEAAADHLFGRVPMLLRVEAVRAAEVGDAAFGGHARAAEEHHAAGRGVGYPCAKRFRCASRRIVHAPPFAFGSSAPSYSRNRCFT